MRLICKKYQHTLHYFRKTNLKFQYKKCGRHSAYVQELLWKTANYHFNIG